MLKLESFDWAGIASAIGDIFSGDFDFGSIFGGGSSGSGGGISDWIKRGKQVYDIYQDITGAAETAADAIEFYTGATEAATTATSLYGGSVGATVTATGAYVSGTSAAVGSTAAFGSGLTGLGASATTATTGLTGLGGAASGLSASAGAASTGLAGLGTAATSTATATGAAATGISGVGASAASAGPYIAAAVVAIGVLDKALGDSSATKFSNQFQGLAKGVAGGTEELYKLAGGFEAVGQADKLWVTGSVEGLAEIRNQLNNSAEGYKAFLNTVNGTPVLRVLDDMGRGVEGLNEQISTVGATASQTFTEASTVMSQFNFHTRQVSDKYEQLIDVVEDGFGRVTNAASGPVIEIDKFSVTGIAAIQKFRDELDQTSVNFENLEAEVKGVGGLLVDSIDDTGLKITQSFSGSLEKTTAKISEFGIQAANDFETFGDQANEVGLGLKDSTIESTLLMSQALAGLGDTSDKVTGDIANSFDHASSEIAKSTTQASNVMSTEFGNAGNDIESSATDAASKLKSELQSATDSATGNMNSFTNSSVSGLGRIIREANSAAAAVRGIGSSGGISNPGPSNAASVNSTSSGSNGDVVNEIKALKAEVTTLRNDQKNQSTKNRLTAKAA